MQILNLIFLIYFALHTGILAPNTAEAMYSGPPTELLCIAQKESGMHQFNADGTPLISKTDDVGTLQLNIPTWKPLADKMGLDIEHNAQDNIEMGIYLFNKYGGKIWSTDKYCKGSTDT